MHAEFTVNADRIVEKFMNDKKWKNRLDRTDVLPLARGYAYRAQFQMPFYCGDFVRALKSRSRSPVA